MTTTVTTQYPEEGTMVIDVVFTDEADGLVVPNTDTVTYTLSNTPQHGVDPTIVNSLEDVAVSSGSSITVVLTGDDLALLESEQGYPAANRVLGLVWEYDSDNGTDLKGKAQLKFQIENYYNIPQVE